MSAARTGPAPHASLEWSLIALWSAFGSIDSRSRQNVSSRTRASRSGWKCERSVLATMRRSPRSYSGAMAFANRVGDIAEDAGHHPAILAEWGKVTVTWWSHKIRGLHKNDLIMAARTDEVYAD